MSGNLLKRAKEDAARFVSSGGFQLDIFLSNGDKSVQVSGTGTGTWMMFDDTTSGKAINSASDSITIPEQHLIDLDYPYIKNGRPNLNNHKVSRNDEDLSMTGEYVINETHPNSTLGLIVCILGRSK